MMTTQSPFTDQDRADHDRLLAALRGLLRSRQEVRYEIARTLAQVRDRALWGVDGCNTVLQWSYANLKLKARQTANYLAVFDGYTREQVVSSRFALDVLALLAPAEAALKEELLAL